MKGRGRKDRWQQLIISFSTLIATMPALAVRHLQLRHADLSCDAAARGPKGNVRAAEGGGGQQHARRRN